MAQRDHRPERPKDAGEIVGHRGRARRNRRAVGIAREVREAADGRRDATEARPFTLRSGLPEGRDTDHDQRGPYRRERVPAEVPALERAGAKVLVQDMRAGDETADQRLAHWTPQIAGDRLLVARFD